MTTLPRGTVYGDRSVTYLLQHFGLTSDRSFRLVETVLKAQNGGKMLPGFSDSLRVSL